MTGIEQGDEVRGGAGGGKEGGGGGGGRGGGEGEIERENDDDSACGRREIHSPSYYYSDVNAEEEEDMSEAILNSKLDSWAFEYNHLLTSQLDSQRQYFEGLLAAKDAEADAAAEKLAHAKVILEFFLNFYRTVFHFFKMDSRLFVYT